jgi:hypothetical protein
MAIPGLCVVSKVGHFNRRQWGTTTDAYTEWLGSTDGAFEAVDKLGQQLGRDTATALPCTRARSCTPDPLAAG